MFSVLIVCRANICRSPSAQALLLGSLVDQKIGREVNVHSAGVESAPGLSWCEVGQRYVGTSAAEFAERHHSRQISSADIESANLILTMAREQRAAVVRAVPAASSRTFTLIEAARLGAEVVAQIAADGHAHHAVHWSVSPLPESTTVADRLGWLTAEMNAARGLVPMPPPNSHGHWRHRSGSSGIDVLDAHGPDRARHSAVLAEIARAVGALTESFRAVTSR